MSKYNIIHSGNNTNRTRKCVSCGTERIKAGRRYCSKECRQQINWVLSLSKGLLRVFNARYAAFSFNESHVIFDVLPVWSKEISRFTYKRTNGKKPAEDLKKLVLQSGKEWYGMIDNKNSKSYASLFILSKTNYKRISPDSIKPDQKLRPRFSKGERDSMKFLQLKMEELLSEGQVAKIKFAYKKLAKIHHPDLGGDEEKFKRLSNAHQEMLSWAENPQFTTKKSLVDCWSYDGFTNRWAPPL